MAITITAGDVADADFLLLLFFGGDEITRPSPSTLLNVAAGILHGGRVEFSGVKILLKVSWRTFNKFCSYCSKLFSVNWHLICRRRHCCILVPFWNSCLVVPISDRVGWKMPLLARLDNIKKWNLSVNKNIARSIYK